MIVNRSDRNTSLCKLIEDNTQTVFLDANFLIPPDRSKLKIPPISFKKYSEIWLDPIFDAFPNLAIHESVYDELVEDSIKSYADAKSSEFPSKLRVYMDSELSKKEKSLMQTYIRKLAQYSKYIPEYDNSKDRGEVKSLSYMAVKGFLYFAANDNLPMLLIHKAKELSTGLDDIGLLEMYEIIYYLYNLKKYDNNGLRMLYKYQYYLTKQEKKVNPGWGDFINNMDFLYNN